MGTETESPLMEGEDLKFDIMSPVVEDGERLQQRHYDTFVRPKYSGTCPFKGLKADLLVTKDKLKFMTYAMKERKDDWNDLGSSFNWGCNAGVRVDTTRSLKLKDLYVSHGFAPRHGRSLTAILRKDKQKFHFMSDRLVGCVRHKNYLLCSVNMTAMNIMKLLLNEGNKIHFCNGDPSQAAQ